MLCVQKSIQSQINLNIQFKHLHLAKLFNRSKTKLDFKDKVKSQHTKLFPTLTPRKKNYAKEYVHLHFLEKKKYQVYF